MGGVPFASPLHEGSVASNAMMMAETTGSRGALIQAPNLKGPLGIKSFPVKERENRRFPESFI